MVSLVIFFIHGSAFDLKWVTKSTIDNPSIVTIGVYYDLSGGSLQISGSPVINSILTDKNTWFVDSSPGYLDLFKQLFGQVQEKYKFNSQQIYFYAEGNLGTIGGSYLSPIALELINYIQPSTAFLPTGTPECNKFIHYWMAYYGYPTLVLGEKFEMETYSPEELTLEKMACLKAKICNMSLRCTPPLIATFDKKLISESIRFLFGNKTTTASPTSFSIRTPQNHLFRVRDDDNDDDNNVYSFLSEMDKESSEDITVSMSETVHGTPGPIFDVSEQSQREIDSFFQSEADDRKEPDRPSAVGFAFHLEAIPEHSLSFHRPSEDAYRLTQPSLRITTRYLRSDQAQLEQRPYAIPQNSGSASGKAGKAKKKRSYFNLFSCCCDVTTAPVRPLTNIENTSTLRDGDNHVEGSHKFGV